MNTVQPIRDKKEINLIKSELSGRNRLLFIFGINSALRISDILSIKVGDIRNKSALSLVEKKTGKIKQFRLNNSIITAVEELVPLNANDDDWLFPSRKGNGPISRIQAYRIISDAAKLVGVAVEIGTHSLRKTFAYHAYKAGVDLALLMSVLNHSSQRETLRYIGIVQEQIDDVYVDINL